MQYQIKKQTNHTQYLNQINQSLQQTSALISASRMVLNQPQQRDLIVSQIIRIRPDYQDINLNVKCKFIMPTIYNQIIKNNVDSRKQSRIIFQREEQKIKQRKFEDPERLGNMDKRFTFGKIRQKTKGEQHIKINEDVEEQGIQHKKQILKTNQKSTQKKQAGKLYLNHLKTQYNNKFKKFNSKQKQNPNQEVSRDHSNSLNSHKLNYFSRNNKQKSPITKLNEKQQQLKYSRNTNNSNKNESPLNRSKLTNKGTNESRSCSKKSPSLHKRHIFLECQICNPNLKNMRSKLMDLILKEKICITNDQMQLFLRQLYKIPEYQWKRYILQRIVVNKRR